MTIAERIETIETDIMAAGIVTMTVHATIETTNVEDPEIDVIVLLVIVIEVVEMTAISADEEVSALIVLTEDVALEDAVQVLVIGMRT